MQWDMGLEGLAVLALMALALGALAWLVFRGRHGWWPTAIATVGFLVVGMLISEGVFGWATATDLQPNIGGLSFDEVLLALVASAVIVVVAGLVDARRTHTPQHR